MNKLSLSLFSRLYLSVIVIVILSVTLTTIVTEIYTEEEDVNFFIKDAGVLFEHLKLNENFDNEAEQKNIVLPFPLHHYFSAKIINTELNANACTSCQFLKSINKVNYYELEDGERLAEFSLAKSTNKLLIYEKVDSERSDEELEELLIETESAEVIFFSLIIITLLFLGITIYWPIKNLQNQIKALIDTHQQFGSGNMTAKADENIQKPLDKLAHSFNDMAQAIADNVKERDTFSQAIPHEVRTPLSRIQLASGLIRRKSTDLDILALVDDVDNYVVDINELISQIVEYSKINSTVVAGSNLENESEEDQFQTIEVSNFFKSRLAILARNQNKSFTLAVDESVEMTTNPFYLRLLVDNFIKNAFNHAQDEIKLSASVNTLGKIQQLSITIEDDGVGVPFNDRDTIFIAFARLDKSRSRKTGGLGLGLPIAKAAATKMAGKIVVSESSLGGALFSFTKEL